MLLQAASKGLLSPGLWMHTTEVKVTSSPRVEECINQMVGGSVFLHLHLLTVDTSQRSLELQGGPEVEI